MSKKNISSVFKRIKDLYKPLKVISETKANVVVKMSRAQYEEYSKKIEEWHHANQVREDFRATHTKKSWQDEYGSYQSCWVNNETGEELQDHQAPFLA